MPHRVRSPDDPTARLRLAARTGKLSALQKLLGREPPWRINEAREEDGWTALHLACFWGHAACAKALIRAGAAVDLPDIEGRTALHMACLYGESEAVRLLLNAYADKTLVAGKSGKTALDLAHESDATGCVALLLEHDMPPVEPVFGERSLRSATKGATAEHPDVVPRRAQELSPVEAPRAHPAGRRLQLARSLPPTSPAPATYAYRRLAHLSSNQMWQALSKPSGDGRQYADRPRVQAAADRRDGGDRRGHAGRRAQAAVATQLRLKWRPLRCALAMPRLGLSACEVALGLGLTRASRACGG